jgi:hypothetical protein
MNGRIANPVEQQLLDHKSSDDLFVAAHLEASLLGQQLRLPDEKRDQPNSVIGQMIMGIAQPFVGVSRMALGVITE